MKPISQLVGSFAVRNTLAGLLVSIVLASIVLMSMTANPSLLLAQTETASQAALQTGAAVPQLVRFSGVLLDEAGSPITNPVAVTFAIYAQPSGDDQPALWQETQQITPTAVAATPCCSA